MLVVTVPNLAAGVAIIALRRRILALVRKALPRMSDNAEFWASRVILIGGGFLIIIAGGLLVFAFTAAG